LEEVELRKEHDVILREIDMTLDDPDRQMTRALFELAFRVHPFRLPVIGHRELFDGITSEQIRGYYRDRYVPQNMTLVVVGDVTLEQLELELEKTFAARERRQTTEPVVPGEPPQLAPRRLRMHDDLSICRGSMAYRVPSLSHRDAPGLDMLASVLGGGSSSVLYQALRVRRQLVHEIDASCWNPGPEGLFWIHYTCDTGRQFEVEAAIAEEIAVAAQRGFDRRDLDKARRMALSGEINARKTVSGQAGRLGISEVVVGDLEYPRHYYAQLDNVLAEDLPELVRRYLVPQRLSTVTLDAPPAVAHASQRAARAQLPDFEMLSLPNGARIVFQPDRRLPKVHLRYAALGGPLYESPRVRGVTSLMATLLSRDTRFRNAEAVSRAIEAAGGSLNSFAGNNAFGLGMELLSRDLPVALRLFEEALLSPLFQEDTFKIERETQIAQLKEEDDEIADRGRRILRASFFGDHAYREASGGNIAALQGLELEDIVAQYQRLVVSRNSVLSICGDFDPDAVLPQLEALLDFVPDFRFAPAEPPFAGSQPMDLAEVMDREQAVVFQAFPSPGLKHPLQYAGLVLDELFSDMSGWLFTRIREEKGLAYFVGASRMMGLHTGMFTLYGGTHPEKAAEVRSEFDAAIERLRIHGVPEDELLRARTALKAQKRLGLQSIGSRAAAAALDTLYGLPLNSWKYFDDKIEAVSQDTLREYTREYLWPGERVSLTIGPKATFQSAGLEAG
jgi:zinc protease